MPQNIGAFLYSLGVRYSPLLGGNHDAGKCRTANETMMHMSVIESPSMLSSHLLPLLLLLKISPVAK